MVSHIKFPTNIHFKNIYIINPPTKNTNKTKIRYYKLQKAVTGPVRCGPVRSGQVPVTGLFKRISLKQAERDR